MEWHLRSIQTLEPTEYDRCLLLMEPERRERVQRMRHEPGRRATVLGEWMVKTALAERCGLPPEAIMLRRTEKGKPYAEDLPVQFNLSHSGKWVALALDDRPIGIDIEVLRPMDLKIARRVCTESDLAYLFEGTPLFQKTEDPALIDRFFRIWTAKEAYFKCVGTGITDLKAVSYADLNPRHFYKSNCIITLVQ